MSDKRIVAKAEMLIRNPVTHVFEAFVDPMINRGTGTLGALVNDRSTYAELNAATQQAKEGAVSFQENMQAMKRNFFLRGFFNDRGYDDSSRLLEDAIVRLPSHTPAMKFSYESRAIFDAPDSAKIKNPKPLREAGQYLEQNPFDLAVIIAIAAVLGLVLRWRSVCAHDERELRTTAGLPPVHHLVGSSWV